MANSVSWENEPFGTFAPTALARSIIAITRSLPESWLGRRVTLALRRIVLTLLGRTPIDVETLGVRMRLFPHNNVCEKRVLFTPQHFDAHEREILAKRIGADFTFIDVGANVGAYSLFAAAHAGPGARIVAIEPQSEIFERLAVNIGLNRFGTIKAIACALADKTGELTLFLDHINRGQSSVKIVGPGDAPTILVPTMTLFDLAREERFTKIDAVKLDVEGAEDIILKHFFRNAPESLFPKLLILESCSSRWQIDLLQLLAENGYRFVTETRLNYVFERD